MSNTLDYLLNPPSQNTKSLILDAGKEDTDRLQHNLHLLETWISYQSHLPRNYDRNLLIVFLRGCKHDMQRTKSKLERYFVIRSLDKALFQNRILSIEHDLKPSTYSHIFPLPELTKEGYRVSLHRLRTNDATDFNILEVMRYEWMMCEIRLHHDTLVAGEVLIFDAEYLTAAHVLKIISPELKTGTNYLLNVLPYRLKQFHLIAGGSIITSLVNVAKQLLTQKLAKRIYIHKNWDGLYEYVPKRLLPSDLGGDKKSCRELTDDWNAKLVEFDDWFSKLDDVIVKGAIPKHVEESLSSYSGIEGSFRQLNID